jgi:hypothetical protein
MIRVIAGCQASGEAHH